MKIAGANILRKQLKNLSLEVQVKIDDYLTSKALDIERDAHQLCTAVDNGFLKSGIIANTTKFLSKSVAANERYSAYIEFGTGHQVRIPPGLEKIAAQFKGKNQDHKGIKAQPFFFPAYFKNVRPKKVERDIKKLIQ